MIGHIVVVGDLNMDLVVRAPRHPGIGEKVVGSGFHAFPGGKGANQAVAAARLGGKVKLIGRVGVDEFGQALIDAVSKEGVDTSGIHHDPSAATGVALITVDDSGQTTIVDAPGANACISAEDITTAAGSFDGAAILLLQLGSPTSAIREAIDQAKRHQTQVVLNFPEVRDFPAGILSKVDYLVLNRSELALLTGLEVTSSAIGLVRNLGVHNLVVTLGEEGVMVMENNHEVYIPPYNVEVVDDTAAGDAFLAAFAVALTEGLPPRMAAAWGNAAGAMSVTRQGALPSLPRLEEFEKFLFMNAR
jgi:ribokinase